MLIIKKKSYCENIYDCFRYICEISNYSFSFQYIKKIVLSKSEWAKTKSIFFTFNTIETYHFSKFTEYNIILSNRNKSTSIIPK